MQDREVARKDDIGRMLMTTSEASENEYGNESRNEISSFNSEDEAELLISPSKKMMSSSKHK